jgi:3-deoxy-D-manno-octulosonate 8-phosphate phosphatase (KDO 8-P phosphatase)
MSDAGVEPEPDLAELCQSIELLLLDVDGVLTDGVIVLDDRGVETKHFCVRDGAAVSLWKRAGKHVAILSGRRSAAVDHRAAELGISPVIQGVKDKGGPFRTLLADLGLDASQVCYVGDDLPDLPVLMAVGLSACPSDAAPEVRASVDLVVDAQGGRGAVRAVIETILKSQGTWDNLIAGLRNPA